MLDTLISQLKWKKPSHPPGGDGEGEGRWGDGGLGLPAQAVAIQT